MANNPEVINCPADVWTQVASGVTSATLYKISVAPSLYWQTYRIEGQAAPTDNADAAAVFAGEELYAAVSNDVPIDVYVKAVGKTGQVRVDL